MFDEKTFITVDDDMFPLLTLKKMRLGRAGYRKYKVFEKWEGVGRIIMGVTDRSSHVHFSDGNVLNLQRGNMWVCNSQACRGFTKTRAYREKNARR